MTMSESLAHFVENTTFESITLGDREQIKIRVLDSLGCAIGAVEGKPVRLIRAQIDDFGRAPLCSLIGGGMSSPEQAAFYNSALIRYLDFNDSFLAKAETCHPSDNIGAVLAGTEYVDAFGEDLMTALAVAYQVQCRLSEVAPVRGRGFDHTTQGAYAVAAGVSKAIGLTREQTANAMSICGTAFNALRVTRTGTLSHWKGLAYPCTAWACTYATFLAGRGITGPSQVFEGNKGFMDSISGPFEIDWPGETPDAVGRTIIKRFNAEVHSQSVIEGVLELRSDHEVPVDEAQEIMVEVFDVAFNIIGGGVEGDKTQVHTKEEADHSLPYLVAVALLDGEVMPGQYRTERIRAGDVQGLLQKVTVLENKDFSTRFPEEMPCCITIRMKNGNILRREKRDYEGFHSRPMKWETVVNKFHGLSEPYADSGLRWEIVNAVAHLESVRVRDLMRLLSRVRIPEVVRQESIDNAPDQRKNGRNSHEHYGSPAH